MTDPFSAFVGFGRYLRAQGLPVGTGRIVTFCRAAGALAPLDRRALYWAGRAALVSHKDHVADYDRAFDAYFGRSEFEAMIDSFAQALARASGLPPDAVEEQVGMAGSVAPGEEAGDEDAMRVIASPTEVLRRKSFPELSERERAEADRLIRALSVGIPSRRARRLRRSPAGRVFDLRGTLRRSLGTQGEPFDRSWRERRTKKRALVLLLDVSASMSAYSRSLLQFGYAAATAGQKVEVFCFGTRLTRVTPVLATRDPDRALDDVGKLVEDWAGGTRIGESLKELLDRFGRRALLRGAVVVVCSDGLERGEPALLGAQMARLRRLAHRIVWVNPLKGDPAYRPLQRGMAAALPHVDAFLAGHNVESLEALGAAVGH